MWYAIHASDHEGSLEGRIAHRGEHVKRLQVLNDQGRLLTAGPIPAIDAEEPGPAGYLGSLLIADFPSLSDAQAWVADDPYFAAGVYRQADVFPFKRVLPR
jgi:uncharacterized protein YciI